jgi:hypothetical protein
MTDIHYEWELQDAENEWQAGGSCTEEVIRLDKEGFHYRGQFIADAGEAHCLMLAFLKQHAKAEPEPPTDEELQQLWRVLMKSTGAILAQPMYDFARAVLERWGHA